MTAHKKLQTPLGTMTLHASDSGLLGAWFETQTTRPDDLGELSDCHPILNQAVVELTEYFAGQRRDFSVPLAVTGTPFQQQVWHALTTIPYGETWCYKDLAIAVGNPKASQAVGGANGKNPISIIVPCHRVIGKNGSLTGYAGGVDIKQALLELEAKS